ncbi:hypothetical protein Y032_0230g2956 [Ancylostoma ceylanicum]|uniref:Uncharacterized protein n=1 Tax=Ancylostoma ceylanicum TaxID=53326 RepID=A0A016SGV2_9BILA|nr:hypothetical protein Y032_0230g2956 [Ancylostoma ceylanicum]
MSPGGKSAKSSSPSPPANYSAAGEEFIGVDDFNEDAHTPESKTGSAYLEIHSRQNNAILKKNQEESIETINYLEIQSFELLNT